MRGAQGPEGLDQAIDLGKASGSSSQNTKLAAHRAEQPSPRRERHVNPGRGAWCRGELHDEWFGIQRHNLKCVRACADHDGLPGQLTRRSEKLTIEVDLGSLGRCLDDEEGRVNRRAGLHPSHAKVTRRPKQKGGSLGTLYDPNHRPTAMPGDQGRIHYDHL